MLSARALGFRLHMYYMWWQTAGVLVFTETISKWNKVDIVKGDLLDPTTKALNHSCFIF